MPIKGCLDSRGLLKSVSLGSAVRRHGAGQRVDRHTECDGGLGNPNIKTEGKGHHLAQEGVVAGRKEVDAIESNEAQRSLKPTSKAHGQVDAERKVGHELGDIAAFLRTPRCARFEHDEISRLQAKASIAAARHARGRWGLKLRLHFLQRVLARLRKRSGRALSVDTDGTLERDVARTDGHIRAVRMLCRQLHPLLRSNLRAVHDTFRRDSLVARHWERGEVISELQRRHGQRLLVLGLAHNGGLTIVAEAIHVPPKAIQLGDPVLRVLLVGLFPFLARTAFVGSMQGLKVHVINLVQLINLTLRQS
mmetsp:Transcript_45446/g.84800  ORF Transcript_45446/g.84800 Transcript_45446/m.84800 type:complete len:307 (-) Transcript_45446:1281-2201(-)